MAKKKKQRSVTMHVVAGCLVLALGASACGAATGVETVNSSSDEVAAAVERPTEATAAPAAAESNTTESEAAESNTTESNTTESEAAESEAAESVAPQSSGEDGPGQTVRLADGTPITPFDAGETVVAPECGAGSPSVYEPNVTADTDAITTNQIVQGDIEKFTIDYWTIQLCTGQVLYFNSLEQCTGDAELNWQLVVPDGDKAFSLNQLHHNVWGCGGDTGPVEIRESGTYVVEIWYDGIDDRSGSYKFEILNVPAAQIFDIAVGDEVRLGQPGDGAGSLEFPGSRDRYTLSLAQGDRILLDAGETCFSDPDLRWRLIVPDGDKAFSLKDLNHAVWGCGADSDPMQIPETGEYTIEVYYDENRVRSAAEYTFTVVNASG